MIQTISDLLFQIAKKEQESIERQGINHAPTIGAMYEGLTKKLLDFSLPKDLEINIVSGFIEDGSDQMSKQIDCMVVSGEGRKLPYTNEYVFHVKDVIAVIEVKKNLYSEDLLSAHALHNSVLKRFDFYATTPAFKTFNTYYAAREFTSLFGELAPQYNSAQYKELSNSKRVIYHSLVLEQLTPLRIILGYNGFSSEFGLRNSFEKILDEHLGQKGFAVRNIPQLIVSNGFSLVKTNGLPYMSEVSGNEWGILASSNANPIYLLLEMLFTKIEILYDVTFPWGEDLREENLAHFLSAKPSKSDGLLGWSYSIKKFNKGLFKDRVAYSDWQPLEVCEAVYRLIELLSASPLSSIDYDDTRLANILNQYKIPLNELERLATATRLVATRNKQFILSTLVGFDVYDSKFLVGSNVSG
ncbi:DUF6602 domain-containing protein [Vibrio parahaemolyticus]|nr:hypothetical protein [Vibrio parahaemolyticus]EGQ8902797.1 hypothetical protein [Vibrio parahaemolyticus]EGQ9707578.1 hypothetical protein [Vibrio parahaemolyticus]EGR1690134.1 hypothetical protein [Vibrio parahaemolyticus]EHU9469776.1 hypothetical protein [Vibrio parahaemolyticus]